MTAGEIVGRDITADKPDAVCAACGHSARGQVTPTNVAGSRVPIDGVLVMLCMNAGNCCRRYRKGLTAEQYAASLRTVQLTTE